MSQGIFHIVPFSKNERNYCLATKNLKDTNFGNFFEEVLKILFEMMPHLHQRF